MNKKRTSSFIDNAENNRSRRNAAERYRTMKNRVLTNCLREVLPANYHPRSKRKMSDLDVIKNAIKYIKILTDTLTYNNITQQTAMAMVDAGMVEHAATYLMEQTKNEQTLLEEKIDERLIKHYGSCCPTIGNTTSKDNAEIYHILNTLQQTGFLGHRHDSLGNKNDPLCFLNVDIPTIVDNS